MRFVVGIGCALVACAPEPTATKVAIAPPAVVASAPAGESIDVPAIVVPIERRYGRMLVGGLGAPELERLVPPASAVLSTDAAEARTLGRLFANRRARLAARDSNERDGEARIAAARQGGGNVEAEVDRAEVAQLVDEKAIEIATEQLLAAVARGKHLAPDGWVVRIVVGTIRAHERDARDPDFAAVRAALGDPALVGFDPAHAAIVTTLRTLVEIEGRDIPDDLRDQRARELVDLAKAQPGVREIAAHVAIRQLRDRRGSDRALVYEALQLVADATPDPHTRAAALLELAFDAANEPGGIAIAAACGAAAAQADYATSADEQLARAIPAAASIDPVVRACETTPMTCPCDADAVLPAGIALADRDRPDEARRLLELGLARFPTALRAGAAACALAEIARFDDGPKPSCATPPPYPTAARERARRQIPLGALGQCVLDHDAGGGALLVAHLVIDARGTVMGRPAPLQSTVPDNVAPCIEEVLVHHRWRDLGATTQLTLHLTFDP